MESLLFKEEFSAYMQVASLTILVWDILNNLKNDYQLLFRHPRGFFTMAYFLSRFSALSWAILQVIISNNPSINCTAFGKASAALLIAGMMSTKSLCSLRTCAVWRWNRYIVAFFTFSWLCVGAASIVTAILSTKILQVETSSYCTVIIVEGRLVPLPFMVAVINHTLIVIAITFGVCKNTMRGDLTFRHGIMLMLGKSLPTFSKALLHDSQISYILIAVVSVIALILAENWHDYQPSPFGMTSAMAPYFALVTILTGRVHRNTKLGLYNMVSLQSNDRKSLPQSAYYMLPKNSLPGPGPAAKPIPTEVSESKVDEYRSDYSTAGSRGSINSLDFGLV